MLKCDNNCAAPTPAENVERGQMGCEKV